MLSLMVHQHEFIEKNNYFTDITSLNSWKMFVAHDQKVVVFLHTTFMVHMDIIHYLGWKTHGCSKSLIDAFLTIWHVGYYTKD